MIIPAGSSSASLTVAATNATTAGTLKITASATGYTALSQTETVQINSTAQATLSVATQTVTSETQNAVFPVIVTNSTNGALYYNVVTVNGLLNGEAPGASTCKQIAAHGNSTFNESVNVSANRPGGTYVIDFVVESFTTQTRGGTCGGTMNYVQVDGTLNVNLASATMTVNGGYGQTITNGTSGTPLSVLVTDGTGSPISGAVVTFTSPTTGAGGTFLAAGGVCAATGTPGAVVVTTCTATTNAAGIASSLSFTANTVIGAYVVQTTTPGVAAPLSFEEENQ